MLTWPARRGCFFGKQRRKNIRYLCVTYLANNPASGGFPRLCLTFWRLGSAVCICAVAPLRFLVQLLCSVRTHSLSDVAVYTWQPSEPCVLRAPTATAACGYNRLKCLFALWGDEAIRANVSWLEPVPNSRAEESLKYQTWFVFVVLSQAKRQQWHGCTI